MQKELQTLSTLLGEDLKLNDEFSLGWLLNKNKRKEERQV